MPVVSEKPLSTVSISQQYRVGALLCFRDAAARLLLMKRARQPNEGLWCAVGGKLEMATGESPYECAIREAKEEVGIDLEAGDLALRCILSEKDYERAGHWLMFIFEVRIPLQRLPGGIEEGAFRFFEIDELDGVAMPELDRRILLERVLDGESRGLHVLRAGPGADPDLLVEEQRIGEAL